MCAFGSCVVLWSFGLKRFCCFGGAPFGLLAMALTSGSSAIVSVLEGALARMGAIELDADGSTILTIRIGRVVIRCRIINVAIDVDPVLPPAGQECTTRGPGPATSRAS